MTDSRKRKISGLWSVATDIMRKCAWRSRAARVNPSASRLMRRHSTRRGRNWKRCAPRTGLVNWRYRAAGQAFAEFADEYLASVTRDQKSASTRRAERVILGYWKTHLGGIALDKITPVMVKADREKRLGQGRGC